MAIASERSEFIKDLMEVLGIDPSRTIGFMLRAHVNEAVVLEVEECANPDESKQTMIRRWVITKEELNNDYCR